jgi:hypothetical protein
MERLQMKKRSAIILSTVLIAIVLASVFLVYQSYSLPTKPFHVGVTYCGNSVEEAKQLIDKIKNYTNLFVLQSGPLQDNQSATIEICDYAVNNGLDIIVYYGSKDWKHNIVSNFLNATENRWGNHFLGLYYGDEPGGNMLDDCQLSLRDGIGKASGVDQDGNRFRTVNWDQITFTASGTITVEDTAVYVAGVNDTMQPHPYRIMTNYYPNQTIIVTQYPPADTVIYQQDGTVTLQKLDGSTTGVTDRGNISQFEPYQQLWDSRPLQTYDETASMFEKVNKEAVNWLHNQSSSVKAFTSDYGLYWFDYLGGYDVVLAEFGWNHTEAQHMGLVRGAAALQGKSWGAMLTWKFDHPPYMASGGELYDQMTLAYDNGAEYVVVFNYSPNDEGVGVLQDEHFEELERFWNEHVSPNDEKAKAVKAEAVLVLPADYGWGMRNSEDTIWGLWQADQKAPQVWNALQQALEVYGEKLDIVYEDPAFPVSGYQKVLFWNQTG